MDEEDPHDEGQGLLKTGTRWRDQEIKWWYHFAMFSLHYFGIGLAILATVMAQVHLQGKAEDWIRVHSAISTFGFFSIALDLVLLHKHYNERTYFPYCVSHNLLYLLKQYEVTSFTIPHDVLWLHQKIIILILGYVWVVLPISNFLTLVPEGSNLVLAIVGVQFLLTVYHWFFFIIFYFLFFVELCGRYLCCCCFCFFRSYDTTFPRPRESDSFMATVRNDTWFWKSYSWIYERL